MIKRLGLWLFHLLIAIDHVAYVWLSGWGFVWLNKGACPNPDETISACVGLHAIAGKPWALIAEKAINTLFFFMPNHCRNAINGDSRRAAEVEVSLRP